MMFFEDFLVNKISRIIDFLFQFYDAGSIKNNTSRKDCLEIRPGNQTR